MWLDRAHTLWLANNGKIYAKRLTRLSGWDDVQWDEIGDFSQGILDSILKYKIANKYGPQPPYGGGGYGYGQPGAYLGAGQQGLFGGISTTTLVLIAGAFFLFMAMPPGRR